MPAPVKAFIDPTQGLACKLTLPSSGPDTTFQFGQVFTSLAMCFPSKFTPLVQYSVVAAPYAVNVPEAVDIPKPPVGKMLISTFPPIYRERSNYTGTADTPRKFPSIYITRNQ